jgi:DNA-binding transcriptional ArsR family regulator
MNGMAADHCDLVCLDLPRAEALRRSRVSHAEAASLAERFRALADPTRLTVAFALHEGEELCVCDISWIVERAQNLVSHHLRTLRRAGLVDYRREGKMALYSLTIAGSALVESLAREEMRA